MSDDDGDPDTNGDETSYVPDEGRNDRKDVMKESIPLVTKPET